jgi:hypothetical protein
MTGDEAPIRVKGGSITFELLSKEARWEPQGGKDHWTITRSHDRRADEYLVFLVIKDADGRLDSQTLHSKKKIQIFYQNPSDPQRPAVVELKSTGKKTHLRSTHVSDSDSTDPPVLTYQRRIVRVVVDAESFDLPEHGKLESMLLLDC